MEEIMEGWISFIKEIHNSEVGVYKVLTQFEGDLKVPKCFYSVPFSEENKLAGSIALECFDQARVYHLHECMSVAQIKQIARALGKIQASSVKYGVEKETSLDRDTWKEFWPRFRIEIYTQCVKQIKEVDVAVHESLEAVLPLVPLYFGTNLASTIHKQIGCGRVLVNGDHWSANVLFDQNGDLASIIDWQLSHLGVGVEDLLRISLSAMSSTDRRAHSSELIDEMYDSMEQHLGGAKAPYTREQLFEMYDLLFPHAAFFFAPVLTPIFVGTLLAAPNEEERLKRKEVVIDKIRGIYEDIVIYHEKNEKRRLNLKWK
ncbi:hypothetical protein PMAYCL1PPCAC_13421, partial [Pristionchus mayeri]